MIENSNSKKEYLKKFNLAKIVIRNVERISIELLDFIDLCLEWNDAERLSSDQLLQHPFLTNQELNYVALKDGNLMQISLNFKSKDAVEKLIINLAKSGVDNNILTNSLQKSKI